MSLFRLILIVIIVYLIYRALVRYIIPFLLKVYLKKSQERFFDQNPGLRHEENKKEGEVSVDYVPGKKKGKKELDDDEYIEYEDVK